MRHRPCLLTDFDGAARAMSAGRRPSRPPHSLVTAFEHYRRAGYFIAAATGASRMSALTTARHLGSCDLIAHSYCTEAVLRRGRAYRRLKLVPHYEVAALRHAFPFLERIRARHCGKLVDRTCFTAFFQCRFCFEAAKMEIASLLDHLPELRFTASLLDFGISVIPKSATKELVVRLLREVLGYSILVAAGDTSSDAPLIAAAEELAIITRSHARAGVDQSLIASAKTHGVHWIAPDKPHAFGFADALRFHSHNLAS